jgi:prevent-host-death family protein
MDPTAPPSRATARVDQDEHGARRVPVAELRARLAETLGRVRFAGDRLVLTTHGRPVAAVVSLRDLERLEEVDVVGLLSPEVAESVQLPVDAARLWRTLVDGRYRAPWWSVDTFGVLPGEPVRERWLLASGGVVDLRGEVVAHEDGRSITFTWTEPGGARPSTVRLVVAAVGLASAELTITETGFGPRETARAQEHGRQWAQLLQRLGEHVAGRAT